MFGCAPAHALPELERRFYANLPSTDEQQRFVKLGPQQRRAYLERNGLWRQWRSLPLAERQAVGASKVDEGFHEFAVFMAWGPPAATEQLARSTIPRTIHTFIRCSSGIKVGRYVPNHRRCNNASVEIRVAIADGIVTEIERTP